MAQDELEICIYPYYDGDPTTFRAELHNHDPISPNEIQNQFQPGEGKAIVLGEEAKEIIATLDMSELKRLSNDIAKYSIKLTECLFIPDSFFRMTFIAIYRRTIERGRQLHLRLFIASSASELQGIYWETLLNPGDNMPLASNDRILFSRYLNRLDWHSISIRPVPKNDGEALKILTAMVNPRELEQWINQCGNAIALTNLSPNDPEEKGITLDEIINGLSKGYEIFYLECLGKMDGTIPYIGFQTKIGPVEWINANNFISQLKKVNPNPQLIFLTIRPSESKWQNVAVTLGRHLTASGIPAVVAIQGDISSRTLESFLINIINSLANNGRVNEAMSIARNEILNEPDWWMPALFVRLQSARIWYKPGFADNPANNWAELRNNIYADKCLPILGPGMSDFLLPSHKEIAQGLAKKYNFPLSCNAVDNLPHVAQYLSTYYDEPTFLKFFLDFLLEKLADPNEMAALPLMLADRALYLDNLISDQGRVEIAKDQNNPLRILAELPFSLYITTETNCLLAHALIEAQKTPLSKFCWWHDQDQEEQLKYEKTELKLNTYFLDIQDDIVRTLNYSIREAATPPHLVPNLTRQVKRWQNPIPGPLREWLDLGKRVNNPTPNSVNLDWLYYDRSENAPLIFHLFGYLQYPDSLALSEDDYLKFLVNLAKSKNLIHNSITKKLVTKTLLFVGFQWDSWSFRVLLQYINMLAGRGLNSRFPHFAIQIDPEQTRYLKPELARSYFQKYFTDLHFTIYWGSVEDFFREFNKEIPQRMERRDEQ